MPAAATGRTGGPTTAAAAVHEQVEPRTPLSPDEVVNIAAFKILAQFKTPKDIRISVKGEYWERLPELRGTRLEGTISQWAKKTPPDYRLVVVWEDGRDTEHLDQLFHPEVDVQFLPYADGKPAPRLTGRAAAREERRQEANLEKETFEVDYMDGSVAKKQVWTVERPDAVTVDQRTQEWEKPTLNRVLTNLNTPYKMWLGAALPLNLVSKMVELFNSRLPGGAGANQRKTTSGEIIRFLSYMGALAVERSEPVEDMWRFSSTSRDLRPPPAFGDHGLSKNRFECLRSLAGKLWEVKDELRDDSEYKYDDKDMWRWSRLPVDCFNEHYKGVLKPGTLTGPDETMFPWEGEVGPKPHQIPHSHFIPRKPKDTGAEMNTQADGQCGGIYKIDIERGASDTFKRDYQDEWGYTTALNFRLADSILDSHRIFAGDSRFMSVDAIEDLHYKNLYGIGDVKTKTSRYPVKKIQELCGPLPGDWCLMSSELEDGFKIYAIGHRRGGEVHTFIASCGLTIPGVPQAYREDIGVYGTMEPRKCPKVLNLWSQQQPKIDKNNRFRQDILAIEQRFVTKSFPFRVLTSVLGITFANAYEWFNYFIDSKRFCDDDGFLTFMRSLAYDGMHNNFDDEAAGPASPSAAAARAAASPARPMTQTELETSHRIVPIKSIVGYKGHMKQLCAVCHDNAHKTTTCCLACSTKERIFALHSPIIKYKGKTAVYSCLAEHHACPTSKDHHAKCAIPTGRKRPRGGRKRRRDCDDDGDDSA